MLQQYYIVEKHKKRVKTSHEHSYLVFLNVDASRNSQTLRVRTPAVATVTEMEEQSWSGVQFPSSTKGENYKCKFGMKKNEHKRKTGIPD